MERRTPARMSLLKDGGGSCAHAHRPRFFISVRANVPSLRAGPEPSVHQWQVVQTVRETNLRFAVSYGDAALRAATAEVVERRTET